MKAWIVLASFDGKGERLDRLDSDPNTLERVAAFTSWDKEEPAPDDLEAALVGLSEGGEFLVVSLDRAKAITLTIEERVDVEIVSSGNYVPIGVRR